MNIVPRARSLPLPPPPPPLPLPPPQAPTVAKQQHTPTPVAAARQGTTKTRRSTQAPDGADRRQGRGPTDGAAGSATTTASHEEATTEANGAAPATHGARQGQLLDSHHQPAPPRPAAPRPHPAPPPFTPPSPRPSSAARTHPPAAKRGKRPRPTPRHERWRQGAANAGRSAAVRQRGPQARSPAHVSVHPEPIKQTEGRREIIYVSPATSSMATSTHPLVRQGCNSRA